MRLSFLGICASCLFTVLSACSQTRVDESEKTRQAKDTVSEPDPAAPKDEEPADDPEPVDPEPPVLPQEPIIEPQPEGTVPPDEEAIRAAEGTPSAEDLWFETAVTIDAVSYGVVGDGRTDNSETFRRLLAPGNRTIHVPAGDYVTDKLELAANTALVLEPGVIIRDAGRLRRMDRLLNIRTNNVRITGLGARVVADRQHYTTDEWRHGVYIYGARRVFIEGLESNSHGGDGFYIGGPTGNPSTDVLLKGCKAENNRRQGLSVTSARNVRIVDCEFANTKGTTPQFGIDLEPNNPSDVLDRVSIVRAQTTDNRGGGIMVWLNELAVDSEPVDVTVLDHASQGESPPIRVALPADINAILRYRVWK